MIWVGDDEADSNYDNLEESPSEGRSSLNSHQGIWKPGKISFFFLPSSVWELDQLRDDPTINHSENIIANEANRQKRWLLKVGRFAVFTLSWRA